MKNLFATFLLIACSRHETPELPDLDRKTFSTEKVLQQREELMQKIKKIPVGDQRME
jgi:hypothetical protein